MAKSISKRDYLRYCSCFIIIVCFTIVAAENKPRVSVIDFEAKGVSQDIAATAMELFTTHLVSSGKFIVTERKEIATILKEQKYHLSGCSDKECAISIGRVLNAQFMFYGNIIRMPSIVPLERPLYYITIFMVNIESAVIVRSERRRFLLSSDLIEATRSIVDALSARHDGIRNGTGPYFKERQYGLLLLPNDICAMGVGFGELQTIGFRTNDKVISKVGAQNLLHFDLLNFGFGFGDDICHYLYMGMFDRFDKIMTSGLSNTRIRNTPFLSVGYSVVFDDMIGFYISSYFNDEADRIFGIEPGVLLRIFAPREVWFHVGLQLSYAYSWERISAVDYQFHKLRGEIKFRLPWLKNYIGFQCKVGVEYEYGCFSGINDSTYQLTFTDHTLKSWNTYIMIGAYGNVYNIFDVLRQLGRNSEYQY